MTNTMFSTREVPWMKMGKLVDGVTTAAEAAKLGGLDFAVESRPVFWSDESGATHPVPERQVLVRSDTNEFLSVMSANYPVLQFTEAFDFMDGINPNFVAAGVLKGGRQGFMVVEGPEMNVLNGDDPHKLYIVLRTSHDGSRAIEVSVMPLRNMCMNMMSLNSFGANVDFRWAVRHTSSMQQKLNDAHQAMQKLDAYAADYEHTATQLAAMDVNDVFAENILTTVLPDRPRRDTHIASIIDKWHTADTVGFTNTGWGLLNAVSEHFDWGRTNGTPESRFLGALQGPTRAVLNNVTKQMLSV